MITFANFAERWLEEITAGNPSTVELGHRFAVKILRDWHEIDADTAEVIFCDGAGDGGIDAAVFVKGDVAEELEGDTWMLIQSKYGSSYSGADTIIGEAQKVFATLEGRRENFSSLSEEIVRRIRNFISNCGKKDRLEYVFASSKNLQPAELALLNDVKVLGRAKFGDCFDVDSISIETIFKKASEEEILSDAAILKVPLTTTVTSASDILLTGATKLKDIFEFMKRYKADTGDLDFLYEKNVRKFLGNKKKVNKGIEQTIENYPERFGLYNNGITIVAESFDHDAASRQITLVNHYIVNGCQTTRSIRSVLQRKLNSGGSAPSEAQRSWESRLDQAVAVTKIVIVGPDGEELLTETTRFTNSQNAVAEKDFIALERDFRSWGPAFNTKHGIFLEIQRGAWEARKAFQRQNPQARPQYHASANAFELLKTYAAGWLSEPGVAFGKNPPFSPGGTLFKKMVNDPDFGVEALYAAYLIQNLASTYSFGRGAKSSSRGQTRYLFIMIVVDLIKDVLINSGQPYQNKNITEATIRLANEDLLKEFGETSIQLIDEYLTDGNEDSLYTEPEFMKNKNLNSFLKSEKLGKGDEFSPKLRTLLAMSKRIFRRAPTFLEIKKTVSLDL